MDNENKTVNDMTAAESRPSPVGKKENGFNLADEVLDWLESFVFASFIVMLIFIFVFRTVVVDGDSMNPTLFDNQRLILTHFNYEPKNGDIIVCNSPLLNKTIIKRCIGVAGDTVTINYEDNSVTVNGEKIDEPYLDPARPMTDKPYFDQQYRISEYVYEYTVPEGTVFAVGDNRNGSNDSRSPDVGFVNLDDILGHAVFRFYIGKDDEGSSNPGKIGFLN